MIMKMGNHGKLQKLPQETFVSLTEVKLDTSAGNIYNSGYLERIKQ